MDRVLSFVLLLVVVIGVNLGRGAGAPKSEPAVQKVSFGVTREGKPVDLYTLTNAHGMEARVMTYGGIVVSLKVPDKHGKLADVVLGYDKLDGYLEKTPYFGAIVGRYGNRIANGSFTLDGVQYTLAKNDGPNTLHGGLKAFDKVVWDATREQHDGASALVLRYMSKDGEEGFPGNLRAKVTYTVTDKNELAIDYEATTDKATPINLTHHSYFNLGGEGNGDILGHELMLNADRFTPVDKNLIPTGELRPVKGTPLDFTRSTAIGSRIDQDYEQLVLGRGYDHTFVINRTENDKEPVLAARVREPKSGRIMEVYTTEPGIQLYTGNFLDGTITGKQGHVYKRRYAFCLETQHFPDSPNHPAFPTTILRPGETFRSHTTYRFLVE